MCALEHDETLYPALSSSGVISARSGFALSDTSFQTRLYATMLGKYIANALKQQKEEADAFGAAKKAEKKVTIPVLHSYWSQQCLIVSVFHSFHCSI